MSSGWQRLRSKFNAGAFKNAAQKVKAKTKKAFEFMPEDTDLFEGLYNQDLMQTNHRTATFSTENLVGGAAARYASDHPSETALRRYLSQSRKWDSLNQDDLVESGILEYREHGAPLYDFRRNDEDTLHGLTSFYTLYNNAFTSGSAQEKEWARPYKEFYRDRLIQFAIKYALPSGPGEPLKEFYNYLSMLSPEDKAATRGKEADIDQSLRKNYGITVAESFLYPMPSGYKSVARGPRQSVASFETLVPPDFSRLDRERDRFYASMQEPTSFNTEGWLKKIGMKTTPQRG